MKTTLLVAGLLLASLVVLSPAAIADPGDDPIFSCIPESPCCEAGGAKGVLECLPKSEPCRIGAYYYC